MKRLILPSLLAADYGSLGAEILRARDAGADAIHLDIMDGAFVPNISFGPAVVSLATRVAPDFTRNVHLMLAHPELYVEDYAKAGATTIQVHIESLCDIAAVLRRIRELGCRAGIVLNPTTPAEKVRPYLDLCDEILQMTVWPGFGGQKFIADTLPNIAALRAMAPEKDIMVDGGIGRATLPQAAAAGANAFVAGSSLYGVADMTAEITAFRAL